jgi:F-type H+-transporting ATPase subunit epsilon
VTLRVELVVPDGEVWSGRARMVIAKTLDGDLGVLAGHPPVLGILAEGSLVRILDPEGDGESATGAKEIVAAVSSGFLSVTSDRVSVLAREAQLGSRVDRPRAEAVLAEAEQSPPGEQEPTEVRYSRALLRAAGERS